MSELLFLLCLIVVGLVILAIPICISLFIYRYIKKKKYNKRFRLLCLIPILILGYLVYDAIYPTEGFYKKEFEEATNIDFPLDGNIIFKTASYPDLHGDYTSVFIFEINEESFDILLTKLSLLNEEEIYIETEESELAFEQIQEKSLYKQITYKKKDAYFYFGFFSDKNTIIMEKVSL